ncbi:hypothetical protein HHI36_002823 [Cryptolaemus montrouzieri]|uniref:Thyroglobulin type-1 domain-containing protein n=1 Tax=Cryptolaemus montrouzieri TaxID=559131 RepID=A0ABD2PBW3_9CUCU
MQEILQKKDDYDIVLSYKLPNCTLDGNYAPVQENLKSKFCSTPDGLPIPNFIVPKTTENEKLLDSMNCKCAMALRIMSSVEKPSCLQNGNYNSTQCRRGTCFNVDEDGNQVLN